MSTRTAETARLQLVGAPSETIPALVAVIRRLSVSHTIQEIMETVTPTARTLLAADGVTFVLRDGDQCYYAEEDAISPLWKGVRFPMSACISGWCMTERRSVAIEDIYEDARIPHDAYRPTFVKSLAMVPVRQDDPIAAMGAYWREHRTIEPSELQLLQALANAAGLAVANVQLNEERGNTDKARRELRHRIRNVLAIVQALARRAQRRATDLKEFGAEFSGQLHALAQAQDMLNEPGKTGADIRALVNEQVLLGDSHDRIVCEGPDVAVGADEALDLALALHELGTNARKYGALSDDTGEIIITWSVETEGDGSVAELSWVERGGPAVTAPLRSGSGSALLRNAFQKNGGGTDLRFETDGLVCRMRIPLLSGPVPATEAAPSPGEAAPRKAP